MTDAPATQAVPGSAARRRRALLIVIFLILLASLGVAAWWWAVARYRETTNDAYVVGNVIPLTAQTSGTVVAVAADDTDRIEAGQVLVTLDAADAQVAVQLAEANLGIAVRQVNELFAEVARQEAQVVVRRTDLARAEADLARREGLPADGSIVSVEEVQHARDAVAASRAALKLAETSLAAARVPVDKTTVASHPQVLAAAARLRQVLLEESRMRVRSPSGGWVAKRTVQLGQRIQPGMPLLAVIPLDEVWVEANFRENQLDRLRIGQKVSLWSDQYGSGVKYHGTVAGIGAGTGAAFALIPSQNASGNWIKIIQRLPVRITLIPAELQAHPLRVGLSMSVNVAIDDQSGLVLTQSPRTEPALHTSAIGGIPPTIDERINRIILHDIGGATSSSHSTQN